MSTFHLVFRAAHKSKHPDYTFENEPITVHSQFNPVDGVTRYYATHPKLGCGKDAHTVQQAVVALASDHACFLISSENAFRPITGGKLRFDLDGIKGGSKRTAIRDGSGKLFSCDGEIQDGDTGKVYRFNIDHWDSDIDVTLRLKGRRIPENHLKQLRQMVLDAYKAEFPPEPTPVETTQSRKEKRLERLEKSDAYREGVVWAMNEAADLRRELFGALNFFDAANQVFRSRAEFEAMAKAWDDMERAEFEAMAKAWDDMERVQVQPELAETLSAVGFQAVPLPFSDDPADGFAMVPADPEPSFYVAIFEIGNPEPSEIYGHTSREGVLTLVGTAYAAGAFDHLKRPLRFVLDGLEVTSEILRRYPEWCALNAAQEALNREQIAAFEAFKASLDLTWTRETNGRVYIQDGESFESGHVNDLIADQWFSALDETGRNFADCEQAVCAALRTAESGTAAYLDDLDARRSGF